MVLVAPLVMMRRRRVFLFPVGVVVALPLFLLVEPVVSVPGVPLDRRLRVPPLGVTLLLLVFPAEVKVDASGNLRKVRSKTLMDSLALCSAVLLFVLQGALFHCR